MRVSEQFASDVIVTAIEAGHTYGIGYWARVISYSHTPEPAIAEIEEHEASMSSHGKKKCARLTVTTIRRGVRVLASGQINVNSEVLGQILAAVAKDDSTNIDGPNADIIVQAAVFGELVYG